MKTRFFFAICAVLILLGTTAWANDVIVSSVSIPDGQPQAVIVNNGGPPGTIQLWYAYTGTAFPCGPFAQFNLSLTDQQGKGTSTTYPQTVSLVQSGKGPVLFSPSPGSFSVTGVGWSDGSTVAVSIDCDQVGTPYDGQDIVGNLNESTDAQSHLDTKTTIQVHIKLVFPTACVKLYSFEANQATGLLVDSIDVNAKKNGSITSTNPGQLSVDGLAVNLCSLQVTFDMQVGLDPAWWTNPTGNPGNATFLYDFTGLVDEANYLLATSGVMSKQHETLCIENLTLQGGHSLLMTVHSAIIATNTSQLTNPFSFSAGLYTAGTGCTGSLLSGNSDPDPASAISTLPYTIK